MKSNLRLLPTPPKKHIGIQFIERVILAAVAFTIGFWVGLIYQVGKL